MKDPFEPVTASVIVEADIQWTRLHTAIRDALRLEKFFSLGRMVSGELFEIRHQMGWSFVLEPSTKDRPTLTIWRLGGNARSLCHHLSSA